MTENQFAAENRLLRRFPSLQNVQQDGDAVRTYRFEPVVHAGQLGIAAETGVGVVVADDAQILGNVSSPDSGIFERADGQQILRSQHRVETQPGFVQPH